MIDLDDNKEYYILIDEQGGNFGGGLIYESLEEVMDKFRDWADSDEYEDATLKDWTLGDCIENWTMGIKKYDGSDFVDIPIKEYDYISPTLTRTKIDNNIDFYSKNI